MFPNGYRLSTFVGKNGKTQAFQFTNQQFPKPSDNQWNLSVMLLGSGSSTSCHPSCYNTSGSDRVPQNCIIKWWNYRKIYSSSESKTKASKMIGLMRLVCTGHSQKAGAPDRECLTDRHGTRKQKPVRVHRRPLAVEGSWELAVERCLTCSRHVGPLSVGDPLPDE